MIYSYVHDGKSLINTSDLAVRAVKTNDDSIRYEVVARMLGEDGNTYLRSIGSISENDVNRAYKACYEPKMFKVELGSRLVWTNAMFLRPAMLTKYDYRYEEGMHDVQAVIVLAGKNHHIELNRKNLRNGECSCGGFCIICLMPGDVVNIDGSYLYYNKGVRTMLGPVANLEMKDFSSKFNASTFISTNVTLF